MVVETRAFSKGPAQATRSSRLPLADAPISAQKDIFRESRTSTKNAAATIKQTESEDSAVTIVSDVSTPAGMEKLPIQFKTTVKKLKKKANALSTEVTEVRKKLEDERKEKEEALKEVAKLKADAAKTQDLTATSTAANYEATPVKQRPSKQSYSSPRPARTPGQPPALTRKAGLRTPGFYDSSDDERTTKSRFHSDFDIIGELGKGSFGTVFHCLSRLDGCMYAIKLTQRQAKGAADRDRMLKEVYALAALSDQADTANFHIVRYHQAWMEDDRLYIQTELCSGTLGDEVARGPLTQQRRYKLLREILLALDFIHRNNMVHLDIKPENIFLKNDQYKLGDFGLVTKVSASQDVEEGDSRYMSMELLSGDRSDLTKSDIFSLGATMYELCLGRPLPMSGQEWQDIRAGHFSPLPNSTGTEMVSIIKRMMDPVAANRPTPMSLLKHPQLLSDDQKALNAEKTKVFQANIQLAAQQQRFQHGMPPPKHALVRAKSGGSLPYL